MRDLVIPIIVNSTVNLLTQQFILKNKKMIHNDEAHNMNVQTQQAPKYFLILISLLYCKFEMTNLSEYDPEHEMA